LLVTKKNFFDLTIEQLYAEIALLQEPAFRADQVWQWVYRLGAQGFSTMSNIPLSLKNSLLLNYDFERAKAHQTLISKDETRKWLLAFKDANQVETVWIPEPTRGTLCVSSQVGCTLNCKFCHTGTQPLVRNLKAGEKDELQDWPSHAPTRKIHNLVMMGMGEPLLNYEQVAKAIQIMMHPAGLSFSKRKITLSTSGIVPEIKRCAEELGVNLAVSLHAVTDELRNYLVPINKKYPIKELLEACRTYAAKTGDRKITFEYVLLKGVNDSPADAKKLITLVKGIPAKVNLIPFNPWPGTEFECSTEAHIKQFSAIIEKAGYIAPVRTPRGQDIMAACGQLKSASMKAKAYQTKSTA
jgi:23S rRNA (adenine2503-C2)-methyltransferase